MGNEINQPADTKVAEPQANKERSSSWNLLSIVSPAAAVADTMYKNMNKQELAGTIIGGAIAGAAAVVGAEAARAIKPEAARRAGGAIGKAIPVSGSVIEGAEDAAKLVQQIPKQAEAVVVGGLVGAGGALAGKALKEGARFVKEHPDTAAEIIVNSAFGAGGRIAQEAWKHLPKEKAAESLQPLLKKFEGMLFIPPISTLPLKDIPSVTPEEVAKSNKAKED